MPNPIAHPAASIPFTKAGLVFSALVVGSLAPDVGYFVDFRVNFFMYTFPGLFLFDVPVGFVLLLLFHTLLKWPLLSLLPVPLQRRLSKYAQGFTFGPPKRFLLILVSLLVGAATHVILDSFTHSYGWMVEHFRVFSRQIVGIPLYTILQNLGSLIGIGLLIYWFLRWLPTAEESDQQLPRFSGRYQILFFALATLSVAALKGRILYLRLLTGSRLIGGHFLMVSTIFSAVFIIALFAGIYCVAWMILFHKSIHQISLSR